MFKTVLKFIFRVSDFVFRISIFAFSPYGIYQTGPSTVRQAHCRQAQDRRIHGVNHIGEV